MDEFLCPALAAASLPPPNNAGVVGEEDDTVANIDLVDLPRCKHCSGLLRPDVVWFGEIPYYMPEIERVVEKADMCLVVGTSSTVRTTPFHSQIFPDYAYVSIGLPGRRLRPRGIVTWREGCHIQSATHRG